METNLEKNQITSQLEYLIKNQKNLNLLNKKDIIGYMTDMTKYYNNVYDDRYKFKEDKNYTKLDLTEINREITAIRGRIDEFLSDPQYNNYWVSKFLQDVVRIKKLEKCKEKFENVAKQTERVEALFGDMRAVKKVSTKKGVVNENKTSQELIDERNERLAVLQELFSNNEMEETEFANNVVAVRKCYEREIEKQSIIEMEALDKKEKDRKTLKGKFINCINQIKRTFKVGKPTLNLEELNQDFAKHTVVNNKALDALISVEEILKESNSEKAHQECEELLKEAVSINSTIPHYIISDELKGEMLDMYQKNPNSYVKVDELSSNLKQKFGHRMHSATEVKSEKDITDTMLDFQNYMMKKYEHTSSLAMNKNGKVEQKTIFSDPNVQKVYDEAMALFISQLGHAVECEKQQERIKDEASKVVEKRNEKDHSR